MSAGTQAPGLFDHIGSIVDQVQGEKTAAVQEKQGMEDPGGADGPSSHPSTKPDEDEQAPAEGAQSASNTEIVKKDVPESVDSQPDATPSNVPKEEDTQLGQGVDTAKPVGEDPSTERDYKGKPEGDKKQGDMGGTTHPADGQYGEKYSAEKVASCTDDELDTMAAELGNELAADIANGHFSSTPPQPGVKEAAAEAGAQAAVQAEGYDPDADAAEILTGVQKVAEHHADLVADYIGNNIENLQKQAMPMGAGDPLGGEAEGEDHGTEGAPGEEGGGTALLEAMAGGGAPMPDDAGMGGEGMPGGEEEIPPELAAALGGEEMGEEMGAEMGGELGAPPDALAGMDEEEAMQQLAMALTELGVSPEELAAQAGASEEAPKIAAAVQGFKRSGKFQVKAADTPEKRAVCDYMKAYVSELVPR
jgi:hypothetical protein